MNIFTFELLLVSFRILYVYIHSTNICGPPNMCQTNTRYVLYLKQSARCWEPTQVKGGSVVMCKCMVLDDKNLEFKSYLPEFAKVFVSSALM